MIHRCPAVPTPATAWSRPPHGCSSNAATKPSASTRLPCATDIKGSFYHYFPSKSELAKAVIDLHAKAFQRQLVAPYRGTGRQAARHPGRDRRHPVGARSPIRPRRGIDRGFGDERVFALQNEEACAVLRAEAGPMLQALYQSTLPPPPSPEPDEEKKKTTRTRSTARFSEPPKRLAGVPVRPSPH